MRQFYIVFIGVFFSGQAAAAFFSYLSSMLGLNYAKMFEADVF